MKVLVTGASGLVGSAVVRALGAAGHEARALVRVTSDRRGLPDGETVVGDVTNRASLSRAADGVDAVIHCAAVFSYWGWSPEALERANVAGTANVLAAAADAGVRRVVVTSSSVTLGSSSGPTARDESSPLGPDDGEPDYFRSKLAQEATALREGERLGVDVVIANPTIVVGGPDWRLVPSNALITRYLADPARTTFPGGCNVVSVRDVAAGHLLLLDSGTPGERYVLGGEDCTWPVIHRAISELCGTYGPGVTAGRTAAVLAAAGEELWARLLEKRPAVTRAEARTVGRYYWYRHDRAAALGYRPRPARRALAEALGWVLDSPHVSPLVRYWLTPSAEVYAAREPVPRALG